MTAPPAAPVPQTVRRMRWWDVAAVAALERDLFADPWSEAAFWAELAGVPETRHYLVAEQGVVVVGYAGLFATRHDADVQTLAVARDQQGGGLGTRLLRELLAEAARRGVDQVLLEVRADNEPARRLYERHGFSRIGVRRGYYRAAAAGDPPVDAVVMRLRDLPGAVTESPA